MNLTKYNYILAEETETINNREYPVYDIAENLDSKLINSLIKENNLYIICLENSEEHLFNLYKYELSSMKNQRIETTGYKKFPITKNTSIFLELDKKIDDVSLNYNDEINQYTLSVKWVSLTLNIDSSTTLHNQGQAPNSSTSILPIGGGGIGGQVNDSSIGGRPGPLESEETVVYTYNVPENSSLLVSYNILSNDVGIEINTQLISCAYNYIENNKKWNGRDTSILNVLTDIGKNVCGLSILYVVSRANGDRIETYSVQWECDTIHNNIIFDYNITDPGILIYSVIEQNKNMIGKKSYSLSDLDTAFDYDKDGKFVSENDIDKLNRIFEDVTYDSEIEYLNTFIKCDESVFIPPFIDFVKSAKEHSDADYPNTILWTDLFKQLNPKALYICRIRK